MVKEIVVYADGRLVCGDETYRAVIGKNGITPADKKKEGDGCTPAGTYPLREVFYRADRLEKPETALVIHETHPDDGWCDLSGDPKYNEFVKLPYPGCIDEALWREDHVYDVVVPVEYNMHPAASGKGSAIFFHICREAYTPTTGCVAVSTPDMLEILKELTPDAVMTIREA